MVVSGSMYRIDPRLKLIYIVMISIMTMIIESDFVYFLHILSISLSLVVLYNRKSGVGYFAVYIFYRCILLLIDSLPEMTFILFLEFLIYILIKLHAFIAIGIIATKSMTTTDLIYGFQKIGLPKSFILPFAVTQRFIPTFARELSHIRDSMKMRGITLSVVGIFKAPLKTLEYIFVPLLMRSVKISDELSASAVVRGIENPENRTSMHDLKFRGQDYLYFIFIVLTNLGFIILNK